MYGSGFNQAHQLFVDSNQIVSTDGVDSECVSPPKLIYQTPQAIRSFSIGFIHSVFISNAGRIYCYGNDENFLIGSPERKTYDVQTEIKFLGIYDKFISVHCGMEYTIYLTEKGNVVYCHANSNTQKPAVFRFDSKIVYISGGSSRAVAIDENGDFYVFSSINPDSNPEKYHLDEAVYDVCCGENFVVAISLSGRLFANGTLKSNLANSDNSFIEVPSMKNIRVDQVSAYDDHCLAVTKDGKIYAAGSNSEGKLGIAGIKECTDFLQITELADQHVTFASAGFDHSLIITSQGKLYGCGKNDVGQLMSDPNIHHNPQITTPTLITPNNPDDRVTYAWTGTGTSVVLVNGDPPRHSGKDFFFDYNPHSEEVRELRIELAKQQEYIDRLLKENQELKLRLGEC